MLRSHKLTGRVVSSFAAAALLVASAAPLPAAGPRDVADQRFADMDGPLAEFVVTPDRFDLDATRTLTDIPPLLDAIDGGQLRTHTEDMAGFLRSSESSQAELDAATDHVVEVFESLGFSPTLNPVTHGGKSMPNVSVTIPGTGCADRELVLSAHYDAKGAQNPGADDDATGMAALFEMARILDANPQPVTIRLVAFSFEEDGLVGSTSMAEGDAAAGTDIVGAVSMDMLGYTDADAIDPFVGMPSNYLAMVADPSSADLARAFGAAAYTYTPEFPAAAAIIDPGLMSDIFRSDHAPFVLQGYQGLLATDTANFRNPNYHTPGDTLDTIDWDFVTGSTRAVFAGLLTHASSDQNGNGIADLCPGGTVTPTEPTDPAPTTSVDQNRPDSTETHRGSTPVPATPVASEPTYTG